MKLCVEFDADGGHSAVPSEHPPVPPPPVVSAVITTGEHDEYRSVEAVRSEVRVRAAAGDGRSAKCSISLCVR